MFTGLIEHLGKTVKVAASAAGARLTVDLGPLADDAHPGDSIAVNGACLTIAELRRPHADFDVMAETLRATTLGILAAGNPVNLERALQLGDRLGGHLVQGHVDGRGVIERIEKSPAQHTLWVSAPPELMAMMLPKGSVAIDGVSLTVVNVEAGRFSVWLIPTTLRETTLQFRRPGDAVNLEGDLIGKWINRRLDAVLPDRAGRGVSLEQLRRQGFA